MKLSNVLAAGVAAASLLLAGCGATQATSAPTATGTGGSQASPPSAPTPAYTVQQAAAAIMADEPGLAPFTSTTYDTCVATYLFGQMSPSQVEATVTDPSFAFVPTAATTAAMDNCVMADVQQSPAF